MGAEIIASMGFRAVVLVHKEFLLRQWINAFKMVAPDLVVSVAGKGKAKDWRKADVCIAMIQTLLSEKFQAKIGPEFWERWGVVCGDEIHRYGSVHWSKCLTMFSAPYRIGLTATPRRKDGTANVFKWHIGPVLAVGNGAMLVPKVKRVVFDGPYKIPKWVRGPDIVVEDDNGNKKRIPGKIEMVKFDNVLVARKERNALIVNQISRAVAVDRNILVLTSRREHAAELMRMTGAVCNGATLRLYLGGMKKVEYEDAEENADVIFATYSMAQEGLDIPRIDVLVMGTPRGDVEQAVGRVLRDHPFKPDPVVVDIVDSDMLECVNMYNNSRLRAYKKYGSNIDRF